jgi:predicted DNA-binding protein
MKKAKTIQANYRLPESLLSDLKEVSEAAEIPQTQLVREGIEARVRRAKRVIERRQNAELAPA